MKNSFGHLLLLFLLPITLVACNTAPSIASSPSLMTPNNGEKLKKPARLFYNHVAVRRPQRTP